MKILALESSAKAASVCLTDNGKLIAQYFQAGGFTHSKTLLKMAEDMLKGLEMTVSDADVIAVSRGPGSFTGIRIGVAAAKGLAWGADKKLCGVSTLEAMAHQLEGLEGYIICCVMDARRNQVYNAKFEFTSGKLCRKCDDRAISIEELIAEAKADEKKYMLIGDGASLCKTEFEKSDVECATAPDHLVLQSAWGVAKAAEKGEYTDDITVEYLRLSQAERERLSRGEKI